MLLTLPVSDLCASFCVRVLAPVQGASRPTRRPSLVLLRRGGQGLSLPVSPCASRELTLGARCSIGNVWFVSLAFRLTLLLLRLPPALLLIVCPNESSYASMKFLTQGTSVWRMAFGS